MRGRSLILMVLLSGALASLLACGDKAPSFTELGRSADELKVELAVRAKLIESLRVDGVRIAVKAAGDRVTLSGSVKAKSSQELAEEIARSVSGVREVDNRVTVAPAGAADSVADAAGKAEREVSDAALETRVKLRLLDSLGLGGFKIEVEASEGVVSLRGTARSREHRQIAKAEAAKVPGVRRVIDLLQVKQ